MALSTRTPRQCGFFFVLGSVRSWVLDGMEDNDHFARTNRTRFQCPCDPGLCGGFGFVAPGAIGRECPRRVAIAPRCQKAAFCLDSIRKFDGVCHGFGSFLKSFQVIRRWTPAHPAFPNPASAHVLPSMVSPRPFMGFRSSLYKPIPCGNDWRGPSD